MGNNNCTCCCAHGNAQPDKQPEHTGFLKEYGRILLSAALLFSGIIMKATGMGFFADDTVMFAWYLAAYLPVGLPVLKEAWESILQKDIFSEFTLMSIATLGAFYIKEYPEGVAVMLFYSLGELFQERAVSKAKRNISALIDVRPETATVIKGNEAVVTSPRHVQTGDIIEVKTGERVPLDGKMLDEAAAFNTSALTGESIPRTIRKGGEVLTGMISTDKVIRVEVTRPFEKSALSRILELVQNASERKAPAELFIRKFARVYTPSVCGAALALQREYEFMAAACMDKFMLKTDRRVTKMMLKGYEQDKAANAPQPKYRCLVWACPAHYYTNFTYWTQHCWGVTCVNDMEAMLSYQPITIGDKEQALADLVRCYEKMMMRSHTNGGYVNLLDECWKMCEKFHTNIVIMYDHVSCKNVGGLHGLFEDQARERGIHLIWIPHDVMDPRTVSRREMREAFSQYMVTVLNEKPLDPTLLDYEDALSW